MHISYIYIYITFITDYSTVHVVLFGTFGLLIAKLPPRHRAGFTTPTQTW